MVRELAVLMCCAGALGIAEDVPEESILLQRARENMARNLARLPDYTCVQTIERFVQPGPKKKPKLSDTLRIEVALVHGKELFAWPGSRRFLDTELHDMVPGGAIGTGNFALHAKTLFQTNAAVWRYDGIVNEGSRELLKWNFEVPLGTSGYRIRTLTGESTVGYHGSIYVDGQTLDLVRFDVNADAIPPALQLNSARDEVIYSRMDIQGESFLLPASAELRMEGITGYANLNHTVFSSCRHYSGESTLIFDDPEGGQSTAQPERTLDAREGLYIEMSLDTVIRPSQMAIGDPVKAVLTRALKLGTDMVAPRGATVHGRLIYSSPQASSRPPGFYVGLSFSEIEWANTRVRIRAKLETVQSPLTNMYRTDAPRQFAMPGSKDATMAESVFFVRGSTTQLGRGLRMTWRTVAPEPEGRK